MVGNDDLTSSCLFLYTELDYSLNLTVLKMVARNKKFVDWDLKSLCIYYICKANSNFYPTNRAESCALHKIIGQCRGSTYYTVRMCIDNDILLVPDSDLTQ